MQKLLVDISENMFFQLPIDATISFRPFVDFIKGKSKEETTIRASFYKYILSRFEELECIDKEIKYGELNKFEELVELIYACLSPIARDESKTYWGLCLPLYPSIYYGTDSLYHLLLNKDKTSINTDFFSKPQDVYKEEYLELLYSFILKKIFNFTSPVKRPSPYACFDKDTGLTKFYNLHIDTQFAEVEVIGELPKVDLKNLYLQLCEGERYKRLLQDLPLEIFRFRGFSLITLSDITEERSIENIRGTILNHKPEEEIQNYKIVIQSLKALARDKDIDFELFPFFRVNEKLVYGYDKGGSSLLNSIWGEKRLSLERYHVEAQSYASRPISFYSKNINEEPTSHFLELFKNYKVCSLALTPVFLNETPVGVLGIYTFGDKTFDERTLALTEPATPFLAQLLKIYIDAFNLEITEIIKNKFTSIQTTVQWKFRDVAWHYLYNKKKGISTAEVDPILFKDVFPLYGAIDLRNSTLERNEAVKTDLMCHLSLLLDTLEDIKAENNSLLLDEMIHKCKKWINLVEIDSQTAHDENNLISFLNYDVVRFLNHLAEKDSIAASTILKYFAGSDEKTGVTFQHRRDFESSLQLVNASINNYIESEKEIIQSIFPCYFEKFKTDGVEYDIYIGQSLVPDKVFSLFHVKDIRLWQLKTMANIACLTQSLISKMAKPLYTTQLIFVHNKTIDISFRTDERRFDVEGAYNIKYQMVKKRIDKVHIKDTTERLTQPGKIALVYFNRSDVSDYLEFIEYLQETKVLKNDLEELNLEDLQGVQGLKALRVGVEMADLYL